MLFDGELVTTTVSEINDYESCPSLWASKHVARKRLLTAGKSNALEIGTAVHEVWAQALNFLIDTELTPDTVEALTKREAWEASFIAEAQRRSIPESEHSTLRNLAYWASAWWLDFQRLPKWRFVRALEKPLHHDIEMDGWILRIKGKLDMIVQEEDDRMAHAQLKTWGPSGREARVAQQGRCLHETMYALFGRAIAQEQGVRWVGTDLLALIKLAPQERGGRYRALSEGVTYRRILIKQELIERRLLDVKAITTEMRATQLDLLANHSDWGSILPTRQVDECGGKYGNSICPFYDSCNGTRALNDERIYGDFDPMERYGEPVADS